MRGNLYAISWFLLTGLSACSPATPPPGHTALYVYRFHPPAFLEFSRDLDLRTEIPFPIPPHCTLFDVFSAPDGASLAVELSCPGGQTVLFLDTASGLARQPVSGSDSHFLAWTAGGRSAYLKTDSLGDARLVRAFTGGKIEELDLVGWTYDLAVRPGSEDLIFSFSRGLGYGSELHAARGDGRNPQLLYKDPLNYISFARYSPDGSRILFLKVPDSPVPYSVGELWIMGGDGSNPRRLAEADAGHGYAASWSPDGTRIAFVRRENPEDDLADRSPDSLVSNIYLADVQTGELARITALDNGRAETPYWSPDGNTLFFSTVQDGRMAVQIADIASGEIRTLTTGSTCCPAWVWK